MLIIIFNNSFTEVKLSSEEISITKMAHWQSNKNDSISCSFDNKFLSIKISLIFNPNLIPFSNIFIVFLDSIPI